MYLTGFGNHHQTEAIPGALPRDQNSPQRCQFGLYAEQLSGSAFTRQRHQNWYSWLYRILPSAAGHTDFVLWDKQPTGQFTTPQPPNPLRWSPLASPDTPVDFVDGLFHLAGNTLVNAWLYRCNQSMTTRFFNNHDGEMLLVPWLGTLRLHTEFGLLVISPGMIAVIPRGVWFRVEVDREAAGYLCENHATPLTLPQPGICGPNTLANPRHFLYPKAAFEKLTSNTPCQLLCKSGHHWWMASSDHSPLNVVAWHGNHAPYAYDLSLFNTINTVSFDHPDPSIFSVLSAESDTPGVAALDFVIFPSRWVVAEHTFRLPWFHRNCMSELMGLITGEYDAKKEGFIRGSTSVHNSMTAHGPDQKSWKQASEQDLKPEFYGNTLAFMFESCKPWLITNQGFNHPGLQKNYTACWQGFQPAAIPDKTP